MVERVHITVTPLRRMVAALSGNELYAEPWRDAMDAIGKLARDFGIVRAPVRSGATVNRMAYRIQQKPVPLWARVQTTARNPRNRYPYPKRLEYDPRSRHFGWLRGAVQTSRGAWAGILGRAMGAIEARWGRIS